MYNIYKRGAVYYIIYCMPTHVYEQRDIIIIYNYCYIYVPTTSWQQTRNCMGNFRCETRTRATSVAGKRNMHLQYHTRNTHIYKIHINNNIHV